VADRPRAWEVYQEVQLEAYRPIADIVATADPKVCVVECKLSLGFRVIEQVWRWQRQATLPKKKNEKPSATGCWRGFR
jgi:hypothetical protein